MWAALNGYGMSAEKRDAVPAHDSEPVIKERSADMHAIIETGGKQYKVAAAKRTAAGFQAELAARGK